MSIATRLRYWLAGNVQKAASIGSIPTWARTSWLEPSFDRLVGDGYRKNAAVFVCIQRLSIAYQQPHPTVRNRAGEVLPTSPLQRLLDRPSPTMAWRELALFIATYKAIGGVCYLYKVRNGRGLPIELVPYHAGQMRPIVGEHEWIEAYEYNAAGSGQWVRVDKADVIALKWPAVDPSQPWQPLPPLQVIAHEVDTDTEATRYVYALLANDATPRTVLELPVEAALSQTEYDRLKASFVSRFGGAMRGGVAILEGGAKLGRASLNMQELAFDALRRVPEARISAAFLVPPEYSGLTVGLEHSTYNNVSEARRGFYEDTIAPLCLLDADELTHDLANEFGSDLTIVFDMSNVTALQDNQDATWLRVSKAWLDELVGRREARRMLGLPEELPPDDAYKTTAAPALMPTMPNLLQARGLLVDSRKQRIDLDNEDERDMRAIERLLAAAYQDGARL